MRFFELRQSQPSRPLYVSRPLRNAAALRQWASQSGVSALIAKDDLHVTVAFSREPVAWDALAADRRSLATQGGLRALTHLGQHGEALVLRFDSPALQHRWAAFRAIGASWDFDQYCPHVTLNDQGQAQAIATIKPYRGVLVFGPERYEAIKE